MTIDPARISCPGDLPPGIPLVFESERNLVLPVAEKPWFSFHWMREPSAGVAGGSAGLRLEALGEASFQASLHAAVRGEVSLDEEGRLRLRVFRRETRNSGLRAALSVSARASLPLPERIDELAAALLGAHPSQWLQRAVSIAAGTPAGVQAELEKLRAAGAARLSLEKLQQGLESYAAFLGLDEWIRRSLESVLGPVNSPDAFALLRERLASVLAFRDSVYHKASEALQRKLEADLDWRVGSAAESEALLDCSFSFTAEGLRAYAEALGGDFTRALTEEGPHIRLREGVLTEARRRESRLELRLPLLTSREWTSRLEALASMRVESTKDGRLLVYKVESESRVAERDRYTSVLALVGALSSGLDETAPGFTLDYTGDWRFKAAHAVHALAPLLDAYGFGDAAEPWLLDAIGDRKEGDVEASLSLALPGELASAWFRTPAENDPGCFRAHTRLAVSVQRAMRRWLPFEYFADPRRYGTLGAAYPLLVYQCSEPFSASSRSDFTYDAMDRESVAAARKSAAGNLVRALPRIEMMLRDMGENRTAEFYRPDQAAAILAQVARQGQQFQALLSADAFLVEQLLRLSMGARDLRKRFAGQPQTAVKKLASFAADFVDAFHGRLRRLYAGAQFLSLGAIFLLEAVRALAGPSAATVPPGGVLHLSVRNAGGGAAKSRSFTNAGYRP